MKSLVVALCAACSSNAPPPKAKPIDARPIDAARSVDVQPADAAIDAVPVDAATCSVPPPRDSSTQTELANGTCKKTADCVATDLPRECNVCNFARQYATLKTSLDARGCEAVLPPCEIYCPKHDTTSAAFFRAECRDHKCVMFRWHDGG